MSKKRKASEEDAVSETQDMTLKPPSITCQVSGTRMDLTSNGIHTGELGPFVLCHVAESALLETRAKSVEIDTRAQETEVRLKQTELKLMETNARACMTEAKLKEAETKAHVTEVRLKEAEEKVRNAKETLSKTDVLAGKAHVKACKLEVKLKDSEARAQKAEAHLAMAEKRIEKLERELMEAEKTFTRTEVNHKECEAKAKRVLEKLTDSKEMSHKLEVQLSEAEKRAHIAEAKQIEMKAEARHFRINWTEAEERAKHADNRQKETDLKLRNTVEKLKEKEVKLSATKLKYHVTKQKLAEAQTRAQKTELTLKETMVKLTAANRRSCNLEARLKEIVGKLKELSKTANKDDSGQSSNPSVDNSQTSNSTSNLPVGTDHSSSSPLSIPGTDQSSSSLLSVPRNMNVKENCNLFQDENAHSQFNGAFKKRQPSECYFFKVDDGSSISDWENEKLEQYLGQWSWRKLIEFNEKFSIFHTQLFYANMKPTEQPWGVNTHVYGKKIVITIPLLCEWFGFEAEGEKVYAYRKWPATAEGKKIDYKRWFDVRSDNRDLYSTFLPALHRLLFCFTNNTLTPKATMKTSMEMNTLFYLRHLLSMDRKVNIPFIILSHMRTACRTKKASLPYAHLITEILRHHGIDLPRTNVVAPTNLLKELPNLGWKKIDSVWTPNDAAVNTWIKAPSAKVNQYHDPDAP